MKPQKQLAAPANKLLTDVDNALPRRVLPRVPVPPVAELLVLLLAVAEDDLNDALSEKSEVVFNNGNNVLNNLLPLARLLAERLALESDFETG